MSNTLFEIKLRNEKRLIPNISHFVAESASKLGLSKKKAMFLCFTLETLLELRTNEISEENPEIKIHVEDNGYLLTISETDLGAPYILTKNQQAILKNGLVDKFYFEQHGRKGQCFSFIYKYEAIIDDELVKPKEETLLDTTFSFRRVKNEDEDILEAVKCLYASYGYDYYHQNLYSVASFKKYMQSGNYVPIIGENAHHQIVCYCALDENDWFKGAPELSNLVTKPLARGYHLATEIFLEAENTAREMKYEGIHVSAVAYHPYTQRMCNKYNYTPCAIEYSINPAGTGGYDKDRRLDCVIGIKILNKTKKHELYIDESCNEMIKSIFDKESLNYEIHNYIKSENFENDLTCFVDTDTNNCFIKIDEYGSQFKEDVLKSLNDKDVRLMDVITINVNINKACAIEEYRILKELGFICVGVLPGCENGDYLLLQAFKVDPAYDKIVLEPNYQKLANTVMKLNNINCYY